MNISINGNSVVISGGTVITGGSFVNNFNSGVRGSGKVVEDERPLTDTFDKVVSNGSVDVIVTKGDSNGLKVKADDNITPLVKTRVEDGVLHVETEGSYNTQHCPQVILQLDHPLTAVTLTGSGDMQISGQDGAQLTATLQGSGDLSVSGRVDQLNLSSMGSGDFNGQGLVADKAAVNSMGSGDTTVKADNLNVQLMGSGDCYYVGSPKLTKSVMGSGDIEQL